MSTPVSKDRSATSSDPRPPAGESATKHRRPGVSPLPTDKAGNTIPSQAGKRVPRLPHERDQSADSQAENAGDAPSAELLQQAFEDVERGLVNTDGGLEAHTLVKDAPVKRQRKRVATSN